jgi:hypothetical protein
VERVRSTIPHVFRQREPTHHIPRTHDELEVELEGKVVNELALVIRMHNMVSTELLDVFNLVVR